MMESIQTMLLPSLTARSHVSAMGQDTAAAWSRAAQGTHGDTLQSHSRASRHHCSSHLASGGREELLLSDPLLENQDVLPSQRLQPATPGSYLS